MTTHRPDRPTGLSRRNALAGVAVTGLGVPVIAACGGDSADSGSSSSGSDSGSSGSSGGAGEGSSGQAGALAATTEIPEGSGLIFDDQGVVVTQPAKGEFKAFSTTCTHKGCAVNEVVDTINCPCHGSQFSLSDGSPSQGPATEPLESIPITVEGKQILLG